jgi:protein ImuB
LEARALAVRAVHIRFELEPSFEKDVQALKDDSRKKTAAKEYVKVLTLPVSVRDSKMLLKLLRLLLQADPPKAPIQKIVLVADSAPPRVAQSGLFVPCAPDPEKLELTLARLAKLVGDSNIGSPELLDTYRPETFRMSYFFASRERTKNRRRSGIFVDAEERQQIRKTMIGFRAIRPSAPVNVELCEERPVCVCFRGMHGDVVVASGPWRGSGDWWQEDAWDQNEWDLAVDFGAAHGQRGQSVGSWPQCGVYRIYYDTLQRSWFVRGFYD